MKLQILKNNTYTSTTNLSEATEVSVTYREVKSPQHQQLLEDKLTKLGFEILGRSDNQRRTYAICASKSPRNNVPITVLEEA